jgi:predicted RNA binding protein YcfA (HicA-like mRNA interferase family)
MPYSSVDLIAFAEHLGCKRTKHTGKKGSHRTWARRDPGNPTIVTVIPLGKHEIPDGTVAAILRQLGQTKAALKTFLGR